ncbi:hypothetical protein OG589_19930 [Sphaerisporangium sp. NBC_01403]
MPGHDLAGVYSIREIAGLDVLKGELREVEKAVIVGGGYVGLEAGRSAWG